MQNTKNQIPYAILILIMIISFAIYFSSLSPMLSFFWISGIVFGFILQRARFCFVAAIRDPYLVGGVALTKAMLIAFAITTIGFTAIKFGAFMSNQGIPGQDYIIPVSLATIVGGLIFGVGMVLAGGCASGTLMRTGEGFQLQLVALVFFIIGTFWGTHDFPWWEKNFISRGKTVFLPDVFGWMGALVVQLFIIAFLYVLVDQWGTKKSEEYEN